MLNFKNKALEFVSREAVKLVGVLQVDSRNSGALALVPVQLFTLVLRMLEWSQGGNMRMIHITFVHIPTLSVSTK